jgi:hypothetical protein
MARRRRRGRALVAAPVVELEPSRPPFAALVFICLGVGYLTWYILTSVVLGQPTSANAADHVLRVTPGIAALLIPAALLLRHRDVRWRIPVLLGGTIVLAAVQGLIVLADPLQPVFETLTPSGTQDAAIVPLAAAYEMLVGVVTGLGLAFVALGLTRARRFPDPDNLAVVFVPVAATFATLAGILATTHLDLTGVTVTPTLIAYLAGSLVIGIVRVVAWAFVGAVAFRGWRAGESPLAGWWLALLGAALVLLALVLLNIRGLIDVTDATVDEIYGYVESTAYAAGFVSLLLAFVVGLPEMAHVEPRHESEPAEADRPDALEA